jgi:hypoxanthine phosphoribosyltransferase
MRVRSYGVGTESSGEILVTKDLDEDIGGLDVLIVEDIVDSGRTAACLNTLLSRRNPRSLRIVTLLNKPRRRITPVELAYVGFEIADHFVVGYGLDYAERFRNLPDICTLEMTGG